MSGIIDFNTAEKNAMLNFMATEFANGVIRGFSGTPVSPATVDPGVTPCIEFTKNGALFVPGQPDNGINLGAASNGEIFKDAFSYSGLGLALATMLWFRHYNNDLTKWIQASVNTAGAVMTATTTTITVGGPVQITSLRYYF